MLASLCIAAILCSASAARSREKGSTATRYTVDADVATDSLKVIMFTGVRRSQISGTEITTIP